MSKIRIVSDENYPYETPEGWADAHPLGFMGIAVLVGEVLEDLNKRIEEKAKSHPLYKYYDGVYVSGILLEIEGMPAGVVMMLDDIPQYVPFNQGQKIQDGASDA